MLALTAGTALGLAAPSVADPDMDDIVFLETLRSAGISYSGNEGQVIATAKQVCSLIGSGKSAPDVLAALQERNPSLTLDHGTQFIAISAHSYCPNQIGG
ncbi:DUF732 domain-containing protein [Mycobacterium sp. M1]|uniref:DUF732 domain-containing protein n=2 Tax=Mycolicibacter acidiphilus TaxID=2835306 RepID=A0ABS5RID1_9MYCO|nr:DUF732 domain-containing protein [Mycolicibacter acidiphilus]